MGDKIPCVKETRPALGNDCCVWELSRLDMDALFDGAEPGEKIVLEYCEMTRAEIDGLPDFTGW